MGQQPNQTASIRPTGFFALRTAMLPFQTLVDWAHGMSAGVEVGTARFGDAMVRDRAILQHRLKSIAARPEVREALFIASPSLHQDLAKWLATPSAEDERLEQSVTRYLERMAGRSTPFGLFAGCSVGRVDGETRLTLRGLEDYRRYSRVDNDHLEALAEHLRADPGIRSALRYRPNTSMYRLAGRWRYVRTELAGRRRRHSLVALDADEFLLEVLHRAEGSATLDELTDFVTSSDPDGDVTRDEARAYVEELVQRQVLVSDLAPIVTGPEAIDDMIALLEPLPAATEATEVLRQVRERLKTIDNMPLGVGTDCYTDVQSLLGRLGVEPDPSRLLQIDLMKPAPDATLGAELMEELARAVAALHRIAPPGDMESLRRFREAFDTRYGQREVPLFEVLDEESGIGFDLSASRGAENAPLLDGLAFPRSGDPAAGRWTAKDAYLLAKLDCVLRRGHTVLELTDEDITKLGNSRPGPLPDVLSVSGVLASGTTQPGSDFQFLLRSVGGPSGANLLGRFCHADPELHAWVRKHLELEENARPDAVFAEITHLPEGRLGNVLARPVLREYEIPYLGRSGAAADRQIPISDLLVSVVGDRIVLRSARLQKEVLPRLTNAHGYLGGQSLYRFLCTLQHQGIVGWIGWNWGVLETAPFLPRVTHGRLVLARARWRLEGEAFKSLQEGNMAARIEAFEKWRGERNVPRFVALVDSDNELPIDAENVLSIEAFLQVIKQREQCVLVEFFPGPEALCAHGPEGRFVHELIIPFFSNSEPRPTPTSREQRRPVALRRSFPPGTEWLFFKWYAGTTSVDGLLTSVVDEFASGQLAAGRADQWFFVRYSDPDWHLRLRLHSRSPQQANDALAEVQALLEPALSDGRIHKVQLDTYEREMERYGNDAGILLAEEFFWHDSEAVIEILKLAPGDAGMDSRWRICLRSWDLLLSDLGFSLEDKRALTSANRAAYGRQFSTNRAFDRALGARFRHVRRSLEALFDEKAEEGHPLAGPLAVLHGRSEAIASAVRTLKGHVDAGRLGVAWQAFAGSLLHMHANRLLRSSHRQQELVLYDYLDRLYESQLARRRGRGGPAGSSSPGETQGHRQHEAPEVR